MGRELKRVPLDFDWPHNQAWKGFLNPHGEHSQTCRHCRGSGESEEAAKLTARWYGRAPFKPEDRGSVPFLPTDDVLRRLAARNLANAPEYYGSGEAALEREAARLCEHFNRSWSHHLNDADVAALLEDGRLMDLTHTWSREEGWQAKVPAYVPTPREVNTWSLCGFGHDSINCWAVTRAEAARLGIETACSHCRGEGSVWTSEEGKAAYEAWVREEPPTGEGYQVWETVSEGSPVSPVFETPEGLASWMASNPHGTDKGTTYEQWLAFIRGPGWAPSFISGADGVLRSGVAVVGQDASGD